MPPPPAAAGSPPTPGPTTPTSTRPRGATCRGRASWRRTSGSAGFGCRGLAWGQDRDTAPLGQPAPAHVPEHAEQPSKKAPRLSPRRGAFAHPQSINSPPRLHLGSSTTNKAHRRHYGGGALNFG